MKRRDIAVGLVAVIAAAWAVDRTMLEPRRITAALDTLPRTTLARRGGQSRLRSTGWYFSMTRYGWFLIEDVAAARNVEVGLPAEPRAPIYCGDDTGRILWGVRAATITQRAGLLRTAADGFARAARRRALRASGTRPADPRTGDDHGRRDRRRSPPLCRDIAGRHGAAGSRKVHRNAGGLVRCAAAGPGGDTAGGAGRGGRAARSGRRWDYSVEFVAGSLPRIADPAGGSAAPVVVRDGAAILLRGLTLAARPTLRVRCSPRACAALDGLDLSGALAPWRDHAILRRAVDTAVVAPSEAPPGPLLTPQDLIAADTSVAPERPTVYPVRVAVLPR